MGNALTDDIKEFRDAMLAESIREADGQSIELGFGIVAGRMLEEAEEIVDYCACHFRGTGSRRRNVAVDGYSFDDADGSVRIVIVVAGGESTPVGINQSGAKTIFSKAMSFVADALSGTELIFPHSEHPAADFASALAAHHDSLTRLRFYLVTDGLLSDRVRDWPEENIGGIPSEFHIWDVSRFQSSAASKTGRDSLTVDFSALMDGGLPCLKASLTQSSYSGYLSVIPGDVLAKMYEEYGSRLLEGNVRSFLGKAGKVNKAIRTTIISDPEMFFAFNNGIAATATSVEVVEGDEGPRILTASDLQIVNGGQTTASLAFTRRRDGADLSKIFVQMKLSVVDEETSGELIPKISEFANKQNKVSDSDLFSNHEFHRKMEELSRRLKAPARAGSQRPTTWFYERVKGQYRIETAKMSPSEQARFELDNPRHQVITKTDIAKIENSWKQLPHEVSKGAQKNFDIFSKYVVAEWTKNPLQFNDEYFRTIVVHAIIFRELERLIPKEIWFSGGYRANIVTFTIARLSRMIDEQAGGNKINVGAIWKTQQLSPAFITQIRVIAAEMYSVVTTPEQGLENITEWCKKELAWQRACERSIRLTPDFLAELATKAEVTEKLAAAQDIAKLDVGIEAMTAVLSIKHSNWRAMREWGLQQKELTPKEDQLLLVAATMGKLPTEKQAVAIMQIKKKLEAQGFTLR